ncbi:flagellar biosynthesis protein FlgC [Pradoshia eiseniae]|uniref:Flagellar biosynthesis protein FlgC n=1 Tax=Pradoshia eiseniae TaxID=2064768 RepID=A0A2S7N2A6_9BACI|nr:flagellar hook-basal body protein [Pradoshia eiseniae]PQD96138.1 flagellar biosynthesis protein FlgC [Pradoshia eiseniae]
MFKGFYTAASGMIAQQRRTELLTNNLANAETVGYKEDQTSVRAFPEMLLNSYESEKIPVEKSFNISKLRSVGAINTGVYLQEAIPSFAQGNVKETEHSTDLALIDGGLPIDAESGEPGTVLFMVESANGTLYTRNGNFTLDGSGYLTTASGQYILDENEERIQLGSVDFTVTPEGYISEDGQQVARLGVAFSSSPQGELIKEGEGLYRLNGGQLPSAYETEDVSFTIRQGAVEQSNVDSSKTMTELMTAYRTFEANQKIIQAYDKSMDKAVNEIGRV